MSWTNVALGELTSKIGSGATPRGGQKAYQTEGIPLIRSMNVHDGLFVEDGLAYLNDQQAKGLANVELVSGDVLLNITGASVARSCRIPDKFEGGRVNQHVAIIRPDKRRLSPDYLEHLLINPRTKASLLRIAGGGATREAITKKAIEDFQIPLPPLDEQKRIAKILDQADAMRRLRQRAIDRLNTLGQAIFFEMFEKDMSESVDLDCLCNVVRGSSPRPQGDPRYFGGPVPRLMIADITRDGMLVTPKIDSLTEAGAKKSRPMSAGSVVMAVSGAVGLPAILAVDACIHDGFVGFRDLDDRINARFFYQVLDAQRASNMAKGTGAIWKNLTTDIVKRFRIPVPIIEKQNEFLARVRLVERNAVPIKESAEEFGALFLSLQNRAFRGEL